MKRMLLALLLSLAAVAPAAAQQPSVQQQFDAASAARDAGDWAGALRQFEALESRLSDPHTLAVIRVRKGTVLIELGRPADAAAAIRQGLPGLAEGDANLAGDRFLALLTLGRVAEHDLDYPAALALYRRAAAVPVSEGDRLIVWRGLIQTQLFADAPGALRDADATLASIERLEPNNRQLLGQIHTLKGRALLNLGRFAEARAELEIALRLLGNLTMRVDRADLLARSDLAIAALRVGDQEAARRYLAYTGAGHFDRGHFLLNPGWEPPSCGPDIAPDDVVVLEFYVGADGNVGNVTPIYASRQGPSAILFARAARDWTFDRAVASRLPALFRSVVRLEVRCTVRMSRRTGGEVGAELRRVAEAAPALNQLVERERDRSLAAVRADLAARGDSGGPETLALLVILANHPGVDHPERLAFLQRALPLAADNPPLAASIALAFVRERRAPPVAGQAQASDYEALLALPEIRASPRAALEIRIAIARFHYQAGHYDEALSRAAAAASGLPATDPLRVTALEITVAVQAARGNAAAARAAFDAIGPGAGRCGIQPRQLRIEASDSDFPNAALRWGFEGWATNEALIGADGHVVGTRTIAAYPPFVFGDAVGLITRRTRYVTNFVPGDAPCAVDRSTVHFELPED